MKNVSMVCIFLTAVGVFLPWYSVSASGMGQSFSSSISGFDYFSYGVLVFILSLGSLGISFIETVKKYRLYSMILAVIFSIIPFFHHPNSISYYSSAGSASSGIGWGLYITIVFALVSIITIYLNDYKNATK